MNRVILYTIYCCLVISVSGDYGNLCRCLCGSHTASELTILIPSTYGCLDCTSSICKEHFSIECVDAPEIVTHCINRSAFLQKFVIWSFASLCISLIILGCIMDYVPWLRIWLQLEDIYKRPRSYSRPMQSPVSSNNWLKNNERISHNSPSTRIQNSSTLIVNELVRSTSKDFLFQSVPIHHN